MRDVDYYVEQAMRALSMAERAGVKSVADRLYEVAVDCLDTADRLREQRRRPRQADGARRRGKRTARAAAAPE